MCRCEKNSKLLKDDKSEIDPSAPLTFNDLKALLQGSKDPRVTIFDRGGRPGGLVTSLRSDESPDDQGRDDRCFEVATRGRDGSPGFADGAASGRDGMTLAIRGRSYADAFDDTPGGGRGHQLALYDKERSPAEARGNGIGSPSPPGVDAAAAASAAHSAGVDPPGTAAAAVTAAETAVAASEPKGNGNGGRRLKQKTPDVSDLGTYEQAAVKALAARAERNILKRPASADKSTMNKRPAAAGGSHERPVAAVARAPIPMTKTQILKNLPVPGKTGHAPIEYNGVIILLQPSCGFRIHSKAGSKVNEKIIAWHGTPTKAHWIRAIDYIDNLEED